MKKIAVITGASSGIGLEFAKQLAKKNYSLILIARRTERLEKLAKELPVPCEILGADLTKMSDCQAVWNKISQKEITLFINNAGCGDCGIFSRTDLSKDFFMLHLNIEAVHFFTKKVIRKMKKQNYGSILNVASSAGLICAGPFMATYYASKAYVTSLTQAIAEELKEEGSTVYIACLCPGPVNTEFNKVANVEFSLKGISPSFCVSYALKQMKKRKIVIIPTLYMKAAILFGRLLPQAVYISLVAHQQKRKIYQKC